MDFIFDTHSTEYIYKICFTNNQSGNLLDYKKHYKIIILLLFEQLHV